MSELPRVTGKEAIDAFKRLGFVESRIRGSHHILKKAGHPSVLSVPVHGSTQLKPGTLRGLIRASGHSTEEFVAALR
ncbi:MAG TPA: type II toxin-antitoxin system HicA family toxin [Planctomycetaceae bacterium]|nr:type II toxin-antitoxin system HicA family toxin [Planctomycetaceae bacterium]